MSAADSLATGQAESVHLPAFEGPLDLLLFLVRRNELDICDIPIALVADQYLDIISRARERRLDIAGEFLVMAATLMRIKSRILLPPEVRRAEEGAEQGEDPRWELAQMLLEYNRYKEAAGALGDLAEGAGERLGRLQPPPPESSDEPEPFDRFDLWGAYNNVMRRLSARMTEVAIAPETVSVASCMESLRKRLSAGEVFLFTDLFPEGVPFSRVLVAAHFLALLELTRLGAARLAQDAAFSDIAISPPEPSLPGLFSTGLQP